MSPRLLLGLFLIVVIARPGTALAQSGAAANEWEFALTPFLWGIGMDGTVGIAGRDRDFEASTQDLLKSLDFGIMANFEARRDRWSFGFDLVYTDLGKDATVENASLAAVHPRLDLSMTIVEGDVGYQVAGAVDLLAGIRGVSISTGLRTDTGSLSEAERGFVDPVLGARFRRDLTDKFWFHFRGDVGGFGVGSDFSWFLSAAAGFRVSRLISIDFGYRLWDFDYESDNELKRLDLSLAGFGGGLTFHF